jgi:cytochrome c biogenesis factor
MSSENTQELLNTLFVVIEGTSSFLMFANKSMFWATMVYIVIVFIQGILILATINNPSDKNDIGYFLSMLYSNGITLLMYVLVVLSVYAYCINHSYSYILNDEISDSWSFYAKIIGCIMIIITLIIYNITSAVFKQSPDYKLRIETPHAYGMAIAHVLTLFVYFQFIISMYYQTDGFTI